jgi:hypothetical protein
METHSYPDGGTVGGKGGCPLSALAIGPLLGVAYGIAWIGQCADDNRLDCIPDWILFVSAFLAAAAIGIGARAAINAALRRWRNDR